MRQADIDILVQEGEGTTLEFKEALSRSFAREVVALANTIGGRILLGVRDDGAVVGIRDSNALRAQVQDIARNCDPPVKVRVEVSCLAQALWHQRLTRRHGRAGQHRHR